MYYALVVKVGSCVALMNFEKPTIVLFLAIVMQLLTSSNSVMHCSLLRYKLSQVLHFIEWSNRSHDLQNKFANNTQMTAAFTGMSEQANRLGLGSSQVFTACYSKYQVCTSMRTCTNMKIMQTV